MVAVNLHSQCRKSRREHVKGGVGSLLLRILNLRIRVNHAGVGPSHVFRGHIITKVPIHRQMITVDDNRCILVKILLLYPFDEIRHLFGRAGHDIGVLIAPEGVRTVFTDITVRKMCVHRQHGKIEGLLLLRQLCQLFPCKSEQFVVFVPPPNSVIPRNPVVPNRIIVISYRIMSVLGIIQSSPAKRSVGTKQKHLVVAFVLQNVSQCFNGREKIQLILHAVVADIDLERQAGGLGKHASHRPGGAVHRIAAV